MRTKTDVALTIKRYDFKDPKVVWGHAIELRLDGSDWLVIKTKSTNLYSLESHNFILNVKRDELSAQRAGKTIKLSISSVADDVCVTFPNVANAYTAIESFLSYTNEHMRAISSKRYDMRWQIAKEIAAEIPAYEGDGNA